MSRLRANQITNENANGAPNFPHGLTVTGVVTATTSATTMSQIVVGSAVTANSQGIDVTGIVTATSFKGAATNLTSIPAANLTGTLPAISGANLTGVDSGLASIQVFTSSGTWNRPSGITKVKVIVTGGGGGGGGGGPTWNHGQGGGAGGTAIEFIDVSSTASVTVTVGNAGPGANWNSDATNGGTSSFGSFCSATGGRGGKRAGTNMYGTHNTGVGSGGDINLYGGNGTSPGGGDDNDEPAGYVGGASYWGGGAEGAGTNTSDAYSYNAPYDALVYGAGGGPGDDDQNSRGAGTAGGPGVVYVEEYK